MINVIKLGGSSQSLIGYNKILEKVKNGEKYIIVLSAIKNVTNLLNCYIQIEDKLLIDEVNFLNQNLAKLCKINLEEVKYPKIENLQDKIDILSLGEQLSCKILHKYLLLNEIENTILPYNILKCDKDNYDLYNTGSFYVNGYLLDKYLKENDILIMPGFCGTHEIYDYKCLIGRGGSDTTGSLIASYLKKFLYDIKNYEIYTDVDGMYHIDPRIIENNVIEEVDYEVAQEMASMGAKVLHPYCIKPCEKVNLPILIKNTFSENKTNTIIKKVKTNKIYGITNQKKISVFKITSLNMWNNYGFVYDIFSHFKKFNVDVNIISTSQFNITTTTEDTCLKKLNKLKFELEKNYQVELISECNLTSIIGNNIKNQKIINKIFDLLKKQDIILTSYSSNELSLSLVHKDKTLIKKLYNIIFPKVILNKKNSWYDSLLPELYNKIKNPVYLYNLDIIGNQISKLKKLTCVNQIYYAMKANYKKEIIDYVINNGLGIETVSLDEIKYLYDNFGLNFPVLFTPNFCDIEDYNHYLLKKDNVNVIIDNLDIIDKLEIKDFGLRIDLNCGFGHCDKVITQGNESKFGIPYSDIISNLDKLDKYNIKGLHTHMGSSISDLDKWLDIFDKLIQISNLFTNIEYIDIGGGFAINTELDFDLLNKKLSEIKPDIKLFIEPGRFIVANSGIIIGKVNQIKKKDKLFIGTNIGMNDIIRPSLYNAIHPLYFYPERNKVNKYLSDIVGPICESGDVLIKNLELENKVEINDIVVVEDTGAYCYSMRSNYNLKNNYKIEYINNYIDI